MNMQITILSSLIVMLIAIPHNAQGQNPEADAQVVQYETNNQGDDGYQYRYETSNGISGQEQASFASAGNEDGNAIVQGQYAYTGADGKQVIVTYTADENGFHPKFTL